VAISIGVLQRMTRRGEQDVLNVCHGPGIESALMMTIFVLTLVQDADSARA